MNLFKWKAPAPALDDYDKEVLEVIKQAGGFIDFGAVGSMPLGYYKDGRVCSTRAYHSARKLVAAKEIKRQGSMTNEAFPTYLTNRIVTGELYK